VKQVRGKRVAPKQVAPKQVAPKRFVQKSTQSNVIAVYPGTFDPPTMGHLDVIERASKLFGRVVVAIGSNASKVPAFTTAERMRIMEKICGKLKNVSFAEFSGLVVEFARAQGASCLIRGLRTEVDFTYEMQMALMNRTLAAELETVFIPTSQETGHISSSLVKEVAALGGDVSTLVHPSVARALAEKFQRKSR
jgi:pantetheine-phosphate adenylyltransferase